MKRVLTTGVALAGLAVIGVGAAGAAEAAPVKYGAISYSPSSGGRYAWNGVDRGDLAIYAAVGACVIGTHRVDCADNKILFKGITWGALAIGSNNKFGMALGGSNAQAKLNAVMNCSAAGGTSCKWRYAVPSVGATETQ